MSFSVPSAVVGAVLGATVSSFIGPVARDQFNRHFVYDSYWEGEWETVTCWPNSVEYRWLVKFDQSGNDVIGRLSGATDDLMNERGFIWASIKVVELSGKWAQYTNPSDLGGTLNFVLDDDGNSFTGTYTNGDRKALWVGRRDGGVPTCPLSQ